MTLANAIIALTDLAARAVRPAMAALLYSSALALRRARAATAILSKRLAAERELYSSALALRRARAATAILSKRLVAERELSKRLERKLTLAIEHNRRLTEPSEN